MLTARTEVIDKVVGLESGANDYMTKPFEPRELIARIRVQLRLPQSNDEQDEQQIITAGDIVIDHGKREVTFKNNVIELTKMEFNFLSLLAESPNRAFSREEILNKVWGYENYPSTRTVDTHVLQLRNKLYDELIETVRGVGYRLKL
jgi:DNA-binding response OmpR family regulator